MKSYYCDTATGEVFEADAGQRRAGLMVRQGDDWVESLALPAVPVRVPKVEPLPVEPRAEQQPMWFWEMIGWLTMIFGIMAGGSSGSVVIAAAVIGSGATILMACHAVQEICKAIREGHGKAKE